MAKLWNGSEYHLRSREQEDFEEDEDLIVPDPEDTDVDDVDEDEVYDDEEDDERPRHIA